mmetsp:Transcript_11411/g.26352  ORF Transcript_11411/g.26352 Transcript_11411/m.26352 type:complete len:232 (+) Transcript_11411:652-1347(+)
MPQTSRNNPLVAHKREDTIDRSLRDVAEQTRSQKRQPNQRIHQQRRHARFGHLHLAAIASVDGQRAYELWRVRQAARHEGQPEQWPAAVEDRHEEKRRVEVASALQAHLGKLAEERGDVLVHVEEESDGQRRSERRQPHVRLRWQPHQPRAARGAHRRVLLAHANAVGVGGRAKARRPKALRQADAVHTLRDGLAKSVRCGDRRDHCDCHRVVGEHDANRRRKQRPRAGAR